jgi:putative salt-induced outer membrane protein YdiY
MNTWLARTLALAATLGGSVALAQPAPPAQLTERAAEAAPEEDVTAWALSAGAVVSTGNTRSWTANAGTNFRLVRGRSAVGLEWAFNYGRANLPTDDPDAGYVDTARNSNAKLRYDFFLTPMDALFVAAAHRWDTFAGLDTRLQIQAGYLRNFLKEENHRAWGEIGYDMTYDNFDPEAVQNPDLAADPMCDPSIFVSVRRENGCFLDSTQVVHAARIYLGYENALNENVRFLTGVETLLNLQEIEDVRLNFDAALRSTIAGSLQVELKFKLLFDNVPAVRADGTDFEKIDTITTVSLIYSLI